MTRVFTDMEIWVEVRRRVLTGELSKRAACREYEMHWQTLEKILSHAELDDFDKELEHRGLPFVRYADDFLVFTNTSEAAQRVARSIETYLTRKLKLVVNHQKSRLCPTDGVEFLGFSCVGSGGQFSCEPQESEEVQRPGP